MTGPSIMATKRLGDNFDVFVTDFVQDQSASKIANMSPTFEFSHITVTNISIVIKSDNSGTPNANKLTFPLILTLESSSPPGIVFRYNDFLLKNIIIIN